MKQRWQFSLLSKLFCWRSMDQKNNQSLAWPSFTFNHILLLIKFFLWKVLLETNLATTAQLPASSQEETWWNRTDQLTATAVCIPLAFHWDSSSGKEPCQGPASTGQGGSDKDYGNHKLYSKYMFLFCKYIVIILIHHYFFCMENEF